MSKDISILVVTPHTERKPKKLRGDYVKTDPVNAIVLLWNRNDIEENISKIYVERELFKIGYDFRNILSSMFSEEEERPKIMVY